MMKNFPHFQPSGYGFWFLGRGVTVFKLEERQLIEDITSIVLQKREKNFTCFLLIPGRENTALWGITVDTPRDLCADLATDVTDPRS